jgi:hypothetical protein
MPMSDALVARVVTHTRELTAPPARLITATGGTTTGEDCWRP